MLNKKIIGEKKTKMIMLKSTLTLGGVLSRFIAKLSARSSAVIIFAVTSSTSCIFATGWIEDGNCSTVFVESVLSMQNSSLTEFMRTIFFAVDSDPNDPFFYVKNKF